MGDIDGSHLIVKVNEAKQGFLKAPMTNIFNKNDLSFKDYIVGIHAEIIIKSNNELQTRVSSLPTTIHSSETDFHEAKNDDYTHVVLYKLLRDRFLTTNMLNVTDGTFKKFAIKSKTFYIYKRFFEIGKKYKKYPKK